MRLVDFEVPNKIQSVMIWLAVIQMVSCTRTRGVFASSTRTGTSATAGTSTPTRSRTRTRGTMAIECSPEIIVFLPG